MEATVAVRRVPYHDLRAFSDLARAYASGDEKLAPFFAGHPYDAEARRAAVDRAAAHPRPHREALVDALEAQHERLFSGLGGMTRATREALEDLRDPETVAVVTGQQVGLLGGPLYTLYKTLTAIQLTRKLREETGRRVVTVFWVEGEDHDWQEVDHLTLLRGNEPQRLRYDMGLAPDANPGAVGRLALTEKIRELLDEVDETLAPSDFHNSLLGRAEAAYAPGTRYEDAFVRFFHSLLPEAAGLVYLNPDDPAVKPMVAPLVERELREPTASSERVNEAGEELERLGFHQQVRARPANLFLLEEEGRLALDLQDDGTFILRGTGRAFTRDELLALLEREPERFSPGVVLRPLVQDLLMPTAAYVAGPGETAYFAQYREVYAWAEQPMPIIYPRASATLVESKVEKVLGRYDLSVADVQDDLDALFARVVEGQMEDAVDEAFGEATRHLHEAVNTLKPVVQEVDRTLSKAAESTRAALQKELHDLKDRTLRAERRNQDVVRQQLEKASVNLYPGGTPQERVLSPLYVLNKYGLDLTEHLLETLPLDTSAHQVVLL